MNINYKSLEKIMKGAANHWRLKILFLLDEESGLSLIDISDRLGGHFKTISEHTKKLADGNLITKSYKHRTVLHQISGLGKNLLNAIRKLT